MNVSNGIVLAFVWLVLARQLESGTRVDKIFALAFTVGALILFVADMLR